MQRIEFMKKEVDELKNIIDARQAENEQMKTRLMIGRTGLKLRKIFRGMDELKQVLEQQQVQIEQLTNEADDWKNRFETSERSLEEVRAQLSAAQQAAEESDSRNYVLEETVQKLQEDRGRLEVCADQTDPPDSEVGQLKQVSEQKEVDIEELRNEVDEWKARKEFLDLKITQLKESMREEQAETEEARNEVYGWKQKLIISENLLEKQEPNCQLLNKLLRSQTLEIVDQTDPLYCEMDQLTQVLKQKQVEIEQLNDEVQEWKGRKRLVDLKMTRLKQCIKLMSMEADTLAQTVSAEDDGLLLERGKEISKKGLVSSLDDNVAAQRDQVQDSKEMEEQVEVCVEKQEEIEDCTENNSLGEQDGLFMQEKRTGQ
ncbi:hypothetical protein WMY93_028358 [Mugilogobius chulae]|uniref:Uncharacterized protein n=1 Tax=Mugilogobius chulae TaxID=88201 RepID=A0AAW0MWZ3_9GOBI